MDQIDIELRYSYWYIAPGYSVLLNLQTRTNVVWFGQQNLGYNDFLRNLSLSRIASVPGYVWVTRVAQIFLSFPLISTDLSSLLPKPQSELMADKI